MADKHDPLKPWGDVFRFPQEFRTDSEATERTVIEKTISMEPQRDLAVTGTVVVQRASGNGQVWATVIRWICVTALLITALRAGTAIYIDHADNNEVLMLATQGAPMVGGPQAPLPHIPTPGEHNSL